MIGHFPEGAQVVELLAASRRAGLPFPTAWEAALMRVRRGRLDSNPHWLDTQLGLLHARAAFQRAYEGRPVTRQDIVARALTHAMEQMYDYSEFAAAERSELAGLMEAA